MPLHTVKIDDPRYPVIAANSILDREELKQKEQPRTESATFDNIFNEIVLQLGARRLVLLRTNLSPRS